MSDAAGPVADAIGNWVDRFAPAAIRPYLRLARFDRPIGAWLLLLPCWWSVALTLVPGKMTALSLTVFRSFVLPSPFYLLLFFIGAFVMRGAGCTWNDIVDRDIDAAVARTRSRPIPSGQVSLSGAVLFLMLEALIGLVVLLQFNGFAIGLGVASLAVVAVYPFMKRLTYWPQVVLGLAFSWGALMGWAAAFGRLELPALFLYAGSIAWVIGYDTIYAHQDREDDALAGLKSTALLFGERTKPALILFYSLAVLFIAVAGSSAGAGVVFVLGLAAFAAHLAWQIWRIDIDDPGLCLELFRSNKYAGLILFAGIALDAVQRVPQA
ncbi:MAG TPA: 4-hydroxybenzoate octaprenyltransferase [Xanthobacteraceae bacterium]|nr:4-hydroxybenzoate octaprenyltransferase [Xanthobacteraceae bacterium]